MDELILSLFPGIGMFDSGFEAEGFCVVRGPDTLWGGDVRAFHPPAGRFDGVIGGSPCQGFSLARRSKPKVGPDLVLQYSLEMLAEFCRVVEEAGPDWFVLENVPQVPDIAISGYSVQRFDLNSNECGSRQDRLRHFQYGSRRGLVVSPQRSRTIGASQRACVASEGNQLDRRTWADFCELQGLPRTFDLPGMSVTASYKAVGNGVNVNVARVVARSVREARPMGTGEKLCICGCGRVVGRGALHATAGCRKRMERRRKRDFVGVTDPGAVTLDRSRFGVTSFSA